MSQTIARAARDRRPHPRHLTGRAEALLGALGVVAVVALWALCSATGALSARAVPPPAEVALSFWRLLAGGAFWVSLLLTLVITVVGLAIVLVIAVPLAMAIHGSRLVRESTWFPIEFLKPIPPVALIPLTILLWGPTKSVELALVVFAALWPMLTQLVYGLREVSGVALDVARVYRLAPRQRLLRIVVPSLAPFAMTGLRVSLTIALVVSIVTEYVVGIPGLGAMLQTAQTNGVLDRMYALIVAMGLLGLALNGLLAALNRPLLFWHASQRERTAG